MNNKLFFAALLSFTFSADLAVSATPDDFDKIVQNYVQSENFSGTILVSKSGRIVFERPYGLRSRENGVPNSNDTKYVIGSISKQFTAAGILKLYEAGKVQLNEKIVQYLKDAPQTWSNITIHHLLTHTSGIKNYPDLPDLMKVWSVYHTFDQLLAFFYPHSLNFNPGEKFAYSNPGYNILAATLEKVSGTAFSDFMAKEIFEANSMNDTGMYHESLIVPKMSTGYIEHEGQMFKSCCADSSNSLGAGSVYSTVEDLMKWDSIIRQEGFFTKDTLDRFTTSYVQMPDGDRYYAYGWVIEKIDGHYSIWHNGLNNGFTSAIYRFPNDQVLVVVLSNKHNTSVDKISRDLAKLAF